MNRDGYRDQIVTCDVGVSLHSKTHPLFMKYSNGTSTQYYAYHYPSLFPVLFLQSLYVPFLIQRIFHSLVLIRGDVFTGCTTPFVTGVIIGIIGALVGASGLIIACVTVKWR